MSLDELRRSARNLENTIESTLVAFANLVSSGAASQHVPSSTAEGAPAERLERELAANLERLGELNEAMSRYASPSGGLSLHALQRHREILHDYSSEFQKARGAIRAARDRASLLDSVRSDIRDFRAAAMPAGGDARNGDASLLRERNALHHSLRMADDVIGRAQATQGSLFEQRSLLGNIQQNVIGLGDRMPGLASLINSIGARKNRDVVVLSGTAAFCFVVLFWLTFL